MSAASRLFGPMRVPFLALTLACVALGVATAYHATGRVAWEYAAPAFVAALAAHVSVNANRVRAGILITPPESEKR